MGHFTAENAGGGELVFGRVTYDMIASFWTTPQAKETMPVVADSMNNMPKVVFSKTMYKASWKNTRLFKGGIAEEMRKPKKESGEGMVMLGSGTIAEAICHLS